MTNAELKQIAIERLKFQISECDHRIEMSLTCHTKTSESKREHFAREMGRRSGLIEAARIFGIKEDEFECVSWHSKQISATQDAANVPYQNQF